MLLFQTAVQEMITSRKELEAGKKQDKESRWMEIKALEERKVKIEEECKIMFMDISGFDETQKAFVETTRAQIIECEWGVKIGVLDDLCACILTICHSYVVDHKLCLNLNLRCMCSSSSEHCYCHTVFFCKSVGQCTATAIQSFG